VTDSARRWFRPQLDTLWRIEPQLAQRGCCSAPPLLAIGDDAIDSPNSIEVYTGAVTQGQAAVARHVVAAAGTPMRVGTGAVSAMPFEDRFAKRETLGISPRMAAVKFAMSGSLIKEISPVSRPCRTGAFSRSGCRAIVAFRQRSQDLGLVRREKFYKRFGTPWSLDQELVANRLYSKTRVMSATKKRHSVHASSSSPASSPSPRP
jgi:hypothetical protein